MSSAGRWGGTLSQMERETMYKVRVEGAQSIAVVGKPMPMGTGHRMRIKKGWNYVPYHRQTSERLERGMMEFAFQVNDFIKGQFSFAQYYGPQTGWVGSMDTLHPGEGHMMKVQATNMAWFDGDRPARMAAAASNGNGRRLANAGAPSLGDAAAMPKAWSAFNGHKYEQSLAMTASVLGKDGKPVSTGYLAAFAADGSLRGVQAIHTGTPAVFFLMVFANKDGEHITFKYAPDASTIVDLDDTKLVFHADDIIGNMLAPYELRPCTTTPASAKGGGRAGGSAENSTRKLLAQSV
jgi:hypothetical protein